MYTKAWFLFGQPKLPFGQPKLTIRLSDGQPWNFLKIEACHPHGLFTFEQTMAYRKQWNNSPRNMSIIWGMIHGCNWKKQNEFETICYWLKFNIWTRNVFFILIIHAELTSINEGNKTHKVHSTQHAAKLFVPDPLIILNLTDQVYCDISYRFWSTEVHTAMEQNEVLDLQTSHGSLLPLQYKVGLSILYTIHCSSLPPKPIISITFTPFNPNKIYTQGQQQSTF